MLTFFELKTKKIYLMALVSTFVLTSVIIEPHCQAQPNLLQSPDNTLILAKAKKNKKSKKATSQNVEKKIQEHHLSLNKKTHRVKYPFSVSPQLKTPVDFWIMVYTKYDREYEIFHDTENLGIIYSVLNFSKLYNNPALDKRARLAILRPKLAEEEKRIKEMLLRIHEFQNQPALLNDEEKRIMKLFSNDPNPNKFIEAANAKRIRAQTGIRNKFEEAIQHSGAYIEEFNPYAYSKVGASGMWQFMPATGKLYGLQIDQYADQRNDPFLAARAAARLLKNNYEALGTWYLAMNAYNSGLGTMKNAVKATGGTDIGNIIQNYRGGVYGFASRNFVPSFLAVLHITHRYPQYFKSLKPDSKIIFETYHLKESTYLGNLAAGAGIPIEKILELNHHFSEKVKNNSLKIPAGYTIRIPKGTTKKFSLAEQNLKKSN